MKDEEKTPFDEWFNRVYGVFAPDTVYEVALAGWSAALDELNSKVLELKNEQVVSMAKTAN
jgi:hypothetical protein